MAYVFKNLIPDEYIKLIDDQIKREKRIELKLRSYLRRSQNDQKILKYVLMKEIKQYMLLNNYEIPGKVRYTINYRHTGILTHYCISVKIPEPHLSKLYRIVNNIKKLSTFEIFWNNLKFCLCNKKIMAI